MPSARSCQDRYGLPLTVTSPVAVDHYSQGIDALLSGNLGARAALGAAVEADEGFALAHAALAVVHQGAGKMDAARASLARARDLSAGLSRREQRHVAAVAALVTSGGYRALGVIREQLEEFPREAMLFSQAWQLIAFGGAKDRHLQFDALGQRHGHAYGGDWWFLGVYGFNQHELGRFDVSRCASERSLTANPRNAIAAHSVAHICYETEAHRDGLEFLGGWMGGYAAQAPLHCHFSWHLALFELMAGRYRRALAHFEAGVRGKERARSALADAASLLWRCRLYGYTERLPWEAATALAERGVGHRGAPFSDTHAALAYAGAGDTAALEAMAEEMRVLARRGHVLARLVGLPLVEGIAAFARGAYEEAIGHLASATPEIVRMGGSHAQREVFEETLLVAYLRAGRYEEAEAQLRRRLGRRERARDLFWLGQAQAAHGDVEGASASARQGRVRWPDADPDAPELAALTVVLGGHGVGPLHGNRDGSAPD